MAIEVKTNFDASSLGEELITKLETNFGRVMEEMAEQIVTRSRNQLDVDGHRFVELSKPYAKRKAASGRSPIPDLTFTGRMLAAITSEVKRVGNNLIGRIFFNSVKEAEKARGNMEIRKFFALSRDQENSITEKLNT